MPPITIEIEGPAVVIDAKKKRVNSAKARSALDGCKLIEEPLIDFLADALFDRGVREGMLGLIVRDGDIRWRVTYSARSRLSVRLLQQLVAETDGQISDGAGEGGFDLRVHGKRLHVDLEWSRRKGERGYRVLQSGSARPAARSTPSLFPAIRSGNADRVIKLLERGAAIDEIGRFGQTPLFVAISCAEWVIARELVSFGADLASRDRSGGTVLRHALMSDAPLALISLMLKRGADANAIDAEKCSPLMWAANRGNTRAVERLLAAGANPNHQDARGQNALMYTQAYGRGKLEAILKRLLIAGARPGLRDENGEDAIAHALNQATGFGGPRSGPDADMNRRKATFLRHAAK